MTSREARHAQEMRRRARRRAEERGEAPPEWASSRDGAEPRRRTSTPDGSLDRVRAILKMGGSARAALALERQAAAAAEAATQLPAIRAAATAVIDNTAERVVDLPDKPRRGGQGPEARLRWKSLDRGSEALRAVLPIPCETHHAAPSTPCWDVPADSGSLRLGLCGARIRAAGFTGTLSTRPEQRTPLRSRHS